MAPQASLCSQCRAPLPPATGLVVCPFCGVTNTVAAPVGTAQVRAVVRQVLAEGHPPPPRPANGPQVARVLIIVALIGVLAALLPALTLFRVARPHPTDPLPRIPSVPTLVPPAPPPARPSLAGPTGLGAPTTLALGPDNTLYLVTNGQLTRASRASLTPSWSAPIEGGGVGTIVALGDRVVFAGPSGAFFFDAATGARTGKYLLRHDGFKVSACAAGTGQVLVQTVFDGVLRLDVHTSAPAPGSTTCRRMTDLHCGPEERCGWDHGRVGDMECRYQLTRSNHQVTFCEVDGTKELVLVARSGAKVLWKTPRAQGSSTNPAFASVVDGALVTADRHQLEAFDPTTGKPLWQQRLDGEDSAVVSDGRLLYFGQGDTVVVAEARSGQVVNRFHRPPAD